MNPLKELVCFYLNFNAKKKDVNAKNTLRMHKITSFIYLETIKSSFVIFASKMRSYC